MSKKNELVRTDKVGIQWVKVLDINGMIVELPVIGWDFNDYLFDLPSGVEANKQMSGLGYMYKLEYIKAPEPTSIQGSVL